MPQQYPDPLGAFLAQAFMSGQMPGDPTSNYNFVLDMLSPGAQVERREMSYGPGALQGMFGFSPEQEAQAYEQLYGLRMTPQQQSEQSQGMAALVANYILGQGGLTEQREATRAGERVGMRGHEVAERGQEVTREIGLGQIGAQRYGAEQAAGAQRYGAELGAQATQAQTELMSRQQDISNAVNDFNVRTSAAAMGVDLAYNPETKQYESTGKPIDPQVAQVAQFLNGITSTMRPEAVAAAQTLIMSTDPRQQVIGLQLLGLPVELDEGGALRNWAHDWFRFFGLDVLGPTGVKAGAAPQQAPNPNELAGQIVNQILERAGKEQ